MRILVLGILVLTACGADNHNSNAVEQPGTPATTVKVDDKDPPVTAEPDPKEPAIIATTEPLPGLYSMALATAADLPACDAAHDKQLVYVLADEQFQTCQSGVWSVLDIVGANGIDGTNGIDGVPASANEWRDPVTGKRWFVGGTVMTGQGAGACTGVWDLPSDADLTTAVSHGLAAAVSHLMTNPAYQCGQSVGGGVVIWTNPTACSSLVPHGVFCVAR